MKTTITPKKINLTSNPKISLLNGFILLFFSILSTSITYAQNTCNAILIVEDNGNVDSASQEGVTYKMTFTNNGFSAETYTLSAININSICKNPDESAANKNVILSTQFLDSNKNKITEITIEPGESIHFLTKLTIPVGTTLARWSCNQIVATAKNCTSYKVDTTLHTYVLNPNNE